MLAVDQKQDYQLEWPKRENLIGWSRVVFQSGISECISPKLGKIAYELLYMDSTS